MMLSTPAMRCFVTSCLAVALGGPATAQILNRNLVVNGGAETGSAIGSTAESAVPVPNWTTTGSMTAAKYGGVDFLDSLNYGPRDRGNNYFVAKGDGNASTATQTIDLSAAAADIDAGRLRYYFSVLMGGTPEIRGGLRATFLDASGRPLLETALTSPEPEFSPDGALLMRATSGFLLPNIRSVRLVLELRAAHGGFGWPAADNISLTLAAEPVFGQNLAVNGDAETDEGELSQTTWRPITGWSAPIMMMAIKYDGTLLQAEDPLPENRGANVFGAYDETRKAFQTIDLTLIKDRIDSGSVNYQLSGYLGGYKDFPDYAKVTLTFLDAGGQELGKAEVGPVTVDDRGAKSGLQKRAGEGAVPPGTRQLQLTLSFVFLNEFGWGNMAYADNISVVLSTAASGVTLNRITNSASGAAGSIAPGEMVTLAVSGVTLDSVARMQLDSGGRVKKELAGVKVFFDGTQAPILYVNSSEIAVVAPFDLDGKGSSQVHVEYQGVRSNTVSVNVARTAPGVFTQEGSTGRRGLIYGDTWILNSAANPAPKGSLVTIIWTGGGQTNPDGVDGRIENQTLPRPVAPVTVSIGGQKAELVYAGAVPFGWAGLLMAQAKVPAEVASGETLAVTVSAGGVSSQSGVTMAVR